MKRSSIGPYEVVETTYEGALSVVYRCRDHDVSRDVAVKAVRQDGADSELARRRALREARLRALIVHPHVLPLLRLVDCEGGPLLVAPWLAGGSLRELYGQAISVAQVVTLAEGIGAALDALHCAGWRHGDVSPGNVLFTKSGQPVLADLGSGGRIGARAWRRGAVVCTPHVSAPEVWDGDPADGRADVYSLGALLYRALTGAWPFEAAEPAAFAELHRRVPVPPPSTRTRLAGLAVDDVLLRALAKAPDRRYASGGGLATSLRDAVRADGLAAHDRDDSRARRSTAIVGAAERLEGFAETLDKRERAVLRVMLSRSAAVTAHASHDTDHLAMRVFAPAAALLALEDCGAAGALATGQTTPAGVARACKAQERSIARLLELLAAVGLVAREDCRYRLPQPLAALYGADPHARPLRESAAFWSGLTDWATTGRPAMQMDSLDGAVYAGVAARARILTTTAAQELAEILVDSGVLPEQPSVLDVGAGSGVWGVAIAAAVPGATMTALDRPRVLEETRANAEAAGLDGRFHAVAGDWRDAPLPARAFDVALAANVCHVEPPDEVPRLLRRLHDALRPGGMAVVVDTMPEPGGEDLGALLQSLHLALRTAGGGVHDRTSYTAWLADAGFDAVETIPLDATDGALTALVARRPLLAA